MALLPPDTNSAFDNLLHRATAEKDGGIGAILRKDHRAQKAASEEYFRHWDNKSAQQETETDRAERTEEYASLTRQYVSSLHQYGPLRVSAGKYMLKLTCWLSRYYNLATDFYEFGFGQSFHFCRPALGESFTQGIIRHEHYLASTIGIKKDMKVLDVGCGVGGPAREIAKFTGCHVTGLNINEYQVQRATRYAKKVNMENQLEYAQGDFMVFQTPSLLSLYIPILRF